MKKWIKSSDHCRIFHSNWTKRLIFHEKLYFHQYPNETVCLFEIIRAGMFVPPLTPSYARHVQGLPHPFTQKAQDPRSCACPSVQSGNSAFTRRSCTPCPQRPSAPAALGRQARWVLQRIRR
jgi:hypothetical protein